MRDIRDVQERLQPLASAGRYGEALGLCAEAWQSDRNNPWLLLQMGRLYHRAGHVQQAEPFFRLACTLAPGDPDVRRRGEMFHRAKDLLPTSRTDIENFCNPDLILVQAPGWGVNTPPLGTAMLTSFARSRGYKVLPVDLNVEFYLQRPPEFNHAWDMEQALWFWKTADLVQGILSAYHEKVEAFVDMVVATGAPAVGFSVYDSSALVSLELARMLKRRRPDLRIIFGGPHVSRFMTGPDMIEDAAVDAVAQGEGELILIDFLEHVKAGRPLAECAGLLVRVENRVIDTGDRELLKDLDSVPMPDFGDYAFERYLTPTRLPVLTSRGCPNRCVFCNERPFWKKFRYRSAESVFAEIQAQRARYPFIDFIDFQDSLVNGVIRELERLADLMIENKLSVMWAGQAVIRKEMTAELMMKLKRSGCVCMAYGLETPSASLMLKVGKNLSRGADVNAIAESHGRTGLGATYNFMFGLPGETEEDAFEALEFLRRNRNAGLAVNPSAVFCGFSPGTLAHENPERYGIDMTKGGVYWESTDGENTYIRRLKRFEDFCRLVRELGISTTYPATILLDRNRALGNYYAQSGDPVRAQWYYEAWLQEHPEDLETGSSLERTMKAIEEQALRAGSVQVLEEAACA